MKHNATRTIFSYWDTLRGERAAPERGEIEPGEIRHALADTFILEVDPRHRAAIRLAGTRLCALFGGELRGRSFLEIWTPPARAEVARCIEAVVEDTVGIVAGVSGTTEVGQVLDLEMLLLPLRHRGKPHARILGAISPGSLPGWIGLRSLDTLALTGLRVITPTLPAEDPPGLDRLAPSRPAPRTVIAGPGRRFVVHQGGRV